MLTVKFKPTGELGTIPDNEFDPNIYEVANSSSAPIQPQTPVIPQQQAQQMSAPISPQTQGKGILRTVGDFIAPKITGIGSAAWNTAGMAKDYIDYQSAKTPEQKQAEAKSYTERRGKANESLKQFGFDADKKGNQFDPAQYAKGTTQGALESGSFAVPAGKTYKAAAGLGAISGALRGGSETDKLSDLPNKVISGATGGAIGGVVAKGAMDIVAKTLKKLGASMSLRALRPSKSQISKFKGATGENLSDFVMKNKLYEAGSDQVDELIKPLQQGYDELALKSGTKVGKPSIETAFNTKIEELKKIPNSQIQGIADQLTEEKDLLLKSIGDDTGIDFITKTRRAIDDLIPNSKFSQDPIAAGKTRMVRDIYKGIIDEATGGKTAELGKELSNLYAFKEIAELQGGLGKGNLPVGLLGMLGISGGAGFVSGGSLEEKVKNASVVYALMLGVNNPKVISLLSGALSNAGSKIAGSAIPQIAGRFAGSEIANSPILQGGTNNQIQQTTQGPNGSQYESNNQPDSNTNDTSPSAVQPSLNAGLSMTDTHNPSLGQSPQGVNMNQNGIGSSPQPIMPKYANPWGVSIDQLNTAYNNAINSGNGKLANELQNYQKEEIAYQMKLQTMNKVSEPKKTEKQQMFGNAAQAAQEALQILSTKKIASGIGQKQLGALGEKMGTNTADQQTYRSTIAVARTTVRSAMLGSQMSPGEMESIAAFIPEFDDAPNIAKAKLNTFIRLMNSFGKNLQGTAPDTQG